MNILTSHILTDTGRIPGVRLEGDAVKSHTVMFLEMWNFIRDTDESYEKYLRRNTAFQSLQKGFVQPYSDTPLDNVTLGGERIYEYPENRLPIRLHHHTLSHH